MCRPRNFNVSAIVCLTLWLQNIFERTLWGGSLWDVKVVRHVSDRLNLFDVSKCGGIVGNMSLLNEACSSQFRTAQSAYDTSVSSPPQEQGGPPHAVLSAPTVNCFVVVPGKKVIA